MSDFGTLEDGTPIELIAIESDALRAEILTYGAIVRDLRHEACAHPLVLGLNSARDYQHHSPYFGAIAGRYANRIRGGRFVLGEREYRLTRNQDGRHTLHGGKPGFGQRVWSVHARERNAVTLALTSADGEQGFPGRMAVRCTYRLEGECLALELTASTDAPTVVSLAGHSYFNLDGSERIDGHRLAIAAQRRTPTDAELIPTGEIVGVEGTRFDLRAARTIAGEAFDANFCVAERRHREPRPLARLGGAALEMEVASTEPGLQLYTGDKIDCPVAGLEGRRYGARAGLCLEPQDWPDAPNHPEFPPAVLMPGETYRQVTEYRFSKARWATTD